MIVPPRKVSEAVFGAIRKSFEDDKSCHLFYTDCGYGILDWFRDNNRATNVGIAEQNAVDLAIGTAYNGMRPWIYSHASFLIFRAFESLRLLVRMSDIVVKLIGGGAGNYFEHLSSLHTAGDEDLRACDAICLPVYNCVGAKFDPEVVNDFVTDYVTAYLRI